MKSWPKVKLGQIGARYNIVKIHSSTLYEVISDSPNPHEKVTTCENK